LLHNDGTKVTIIKKTRAFCEIAIRHTKKRGFRNDPFLRRSTSELRHEHINPEQNINPEQTLANSCSKGVQTFTDSSEARSLELRR
jgi:hypothetical protein